MNKQMRDRWGNCSNSTQRSMHSDVILPLLDYVDMLEAALGFYAEFNGYPFSHTGKYAVIVDGGQKAREALDKGK